LLVCLPAWVQAASSGLTVHSFEIKGTHEEGPPQGDITMPWVKSANKALAARINDRFFISQFGALAPRRIETSTPRQANVGTASQTFTVSRNDERVFAVQFETEGCGAYCETYWTFYNFDSRTGHLLRLADLFTKAGRADLAQRMSEEADAQYRSTLVRLRQELRVAQEGKGSSKDEIDELQARIELNAECLGESRDTDSVPQVEQPQEMLDTSEYDRFDLSPEAFKLIAGRCSNHATRALDDVGEITLSVPYAALRSGMTAYGKAVLLNEGSGAPADDPYGMLLRGHLNGKTPITMLLYKYSDQSVAGHYFYDKYGKGIPIAGKQQGDAIELTEKSADGDSDKATIHLTVTGTGLTGHWVGGGKQFELVLAP